MSRMKIVTVCGTVLLIAAVVVVALRERQPIPLPEVLVVSLRCFAGASR